MNEQENRGELVKFAILAVILIGTVIVIALLRPFIFGRIVPAVMGDGLPLPPQEPIPAPILTDTPAASQPADVTQSYPATTTDAETAESPTAESNQAFIPIQGENETGESTEAYPAGTAVPPGTLTHVVQPGENLTAIAKRYNVTVESIIAANNITNPNHLLAGTTLIIIVP